MTHQELVNALRTEAKNNKAFGAACHVFAFRKRARNILTVSGLSQRMALEGFKFEHADHVYVLQFLAKLGLGKLELTGGKVTALKDLRITLQSIGEVAVGTQKGFKNFKQRNRYQELKVAANEKVVEKVWTAPSTKVTLGVEINGKLLKIEVPNSLSGEELANVIQSLQGFPRKRETEATSAA